MKRPNLTGRSRHPVQLRRDADLPSPRPGLSGRRCRIGNFLIVRRGRIPGNGRVPLKIVIVTISILSLTLIHFLFPILLITILYQITYRN
jgi:hypothetical protein